MSEPVPPSAPVLDLDQSASSAAYRPVPPQEQGEAPRAGRFWSVRRIPAAVLALVVVGGAGILLYDVVAVRAHRPAMQWRRATAQHLASWQTDNVWVLVVAAVAVVLGICLIVIAATPGLRWLLPMRRDVPSVRAGIDREAAAMVLRDRAMEVSGVQSVRVRMGRSKVSVRARSHFRELDDVRGDLDETLGAGIAELGLAKPPSLHVHVGRPPKKG